MLSKSPGSMHPPQGNPRLRKLGNNTIKLHPPGSGRNYITLEPQSDGQGKKPSLNGEGEEIVLTQGSGGDGGQMTKGGGGGQMTKGGGGGGGNKPQLRVMIPNQKVFPSKGVSCPCFPYVLYDIGTPTLRDVQGTDMILRPGDLITLFV